MSWWRLLLGRRSVMSLSCSDPISNRKGLTMTAMSDTTEQQSYNGWKNYPTWAVNLWLGNDEGLYNGALGIAERVLADPEAGWSGQVRSRVANMLRDWVRDDLAPDLGASFAADLLGWALDSVDWAEIADAWIDAANELAL